MFISLEGIDGAGKTTQLQLLIAWFGEKGLVPLVTREPGGTPLGERIRTLLLSSEDGPRTATAELLLYQAARAELVETVIRPALGRGQIVIADRFSDSTWAYQVHGRGLSQAWVGSMLTEAIGGLKPDLTLLFDLDPAVSLARRGRADRLEKESRAFFARVRQGYLALAAKEPDRIRIIRAGRQIADVWAEVIAQIVPLFDNKDSEKEN